jgi:hypothetical protein
LAALAKSLKTVDIKHEKAIRRDVAFDRRGGFRKAARVGLGMV